MRNRLYGIVAAILLLSSLAAAQSIYGLTDPEEFRKGRDLEFRNQIESPLLDVDFAKFEALSYFEVDARYRIEAIFAVTPDETYFLMPTSSGKPLKYKKLGEIRFKIDDVTMTLNSYQSEKIMTNEVLNAKYGNSLFIPFTDTSNGVSTYAGGRYIYMKVPDSADTILDFNLAYNPSCAYGSTKYSCPIPPRANRLDVAINAGEKSFSYTKENK